VAMFGQQPAFVIDDRVLAASLLVGVVHDQHLHANSPCRRRTPVFVNRAAAGTRAATVARKRSSTGHSASASISQE